MLAISIKPLWKDWLNFTITVVNTNDKLFITSSPNITAIEDWEYSYNVTAFDDDLLNPSGEKLSFSLDVHPLGMIINSSTGLINWTPRNEHVFKTNNVIVNVTDLAGAFHTQEYIINVSNTNDPPSINNSLQNIIMEEDILYSNLNLSTKL